jgi:oligopeptide/dipeptide ABC transporter ATP-binding protein
MTLILNDEQQMLQQAARDFFAEKQPVKALRDLRDRADATGFDRNAWQAMAELGWAGILIPESEGGVDFGYQGAGQIMEQQPAQALFQRPRHPYTAALMAALPERSDGSARLATIPGMVPGLYDRPTACLFAPRCSYADDDCRSQRPSLVNGLQAAVRCHHPLSPSGQPNVGALA